MSLPLRAFIDTNGKSGDGWHSVLRADQLIKLKRGFYRAAQPSLVKTALRTLDAEDVVGPDFDITRTIQQRDAIIEDTVQQALRHGSQDIRVFIEERARRTRETRDYLLRLADLADGLPTSFLLMLEDMVVNSGFYVDLTTFWHNQLVREACRSLLLAASTAIWNVREGSVKDRLNEIAKRLPDKPEVLEVFGSRPIRFIWATEAQASRRKTEPFVYSIIDHIDNGGPRRVFSRSPLVVGYDPQNRVPSTNYIDHIKESICRVFDVLFNSYSDVVRGLASVPGAVVQTSKSGSSDDEPREPDPDVSSLLERAATEEERELVALAVESGGLQQGREMIETLEANKSASQGPPSPVELAATEGKLPGVASGTGSSSSSSSSSSSAGQEAEDFAEKLKQIGKLMSEQKLSAEEAISQLSTREALLDLLDSNFVMSNENAEVSSKLIKTIRDSATLSGDIPNKLAKQHIDNVKKSYTWPALFKKLLDDASVGLPQALVTLINEGKEPGSDGYVDPDKTIPLSQAAEHIRQLKTNQTLARLPQAIKKAAVSFQSVASRQESSRGTEAANVELIKKAMALALLNEE